MLRASPAVQLWLPRLRLAAHVPSPSTRAPKPPEFLLDSSRLLPVKQNSATIIRSEEHTSELQSRLHLVCRLLLEKKKKTFQHHQHVSDQNAHERSKAIL